MRSPPKRRTATYIIRLWAEYLNEEPPRWCGVVEAVGTGEVLPFAELGQIAALIRQSHLQEKEE